MWGLLLRIGLLNLKAHRGKSAIVGAIMALGTAVVVTGFALVDSLNGSMQKSLTSSLTGHLQIYSADARDKLALFGGGFTGNDFGEIRNFGSVRKAVEAIDGVEAVIPMGLQSSTVLTGNEVDGAIDALRLAQGDRDEVHRWREALVNLGHELHEDLVRRRKVTSDPEGLEESIADVGRLLTADFWIEGPGAAEQLTWLETRIAPLARDGALYYLRNLGTDLTRFEKHFDRFKIVDGQQVPEGRPGFLFSKRVYEKRIKHRVARELDALSEARDRLGQRIATHRAIKSRAERLPRQYRRIAYQLEPEEKEEVIGELHTVLGGERDLVALLKDLLTVDDENLDRHSELFYRIVAPRIALYAIPVGGEITLRSVTQSGFLRAVTIPVYGTYRFEGLEDVDIAGAQNLIDLVTFRELWGSMTLERRQELSALQEDLDVDRVDDSAQADSLFFGGGEVVEASEDVTEGFEVGALERESFTEAVTGFDSGDIDRGLAISAAVVLSDPRSGARLQEPIEQALRGSGTKYQVIGWQEAAGMVGQLTLVLRTLLIISVIIIFLVAVIIINNTMVTATMERTAEIGTVRAIGGRRKLIVRMFLVETLALGLLSGLLGVVMGAVTISVMGRVGIPASSREMAFLFSGNRLYPTLQISQVWWGFVSVLFVSLLSTIYPARLAARVQPVVAMQTSE